MTKLDSLKLVDQVILVLFRHCVPDNVKLELKRCLACLAQYASTIIFHDEVVVTLVEEDRRDQ